MARSRMLYVTVVLLVYSGLALGDVISPTAQYIQDRPYQELSTDNPIGTILPGDIEKASGLVPSVGAGLAVWADGRSGEVAIMGFDLTDPAGGEFLISVPKNEWQEGNPFTGFSTAGWQRWTVYDSANVGVAAGDEGDIEGSSLPPAPTWLVQEPRRQRSPIFTNTMEQTYLSWIDYPGTQSLFPGLPNKDIYTAPVTAPIVTPLAMTNITAGDPAPRESLAGDGRYLTWQEYRYDEVEDVASWDVVVYDLNTSGFTYIDGPVAGKNQIDPDISGDLLVWTQEEDPAGTGATNIYFQDLSSAFGPIAITTPGNPGGDAAAKPAISMASTEGIEAEAMETCFVVWQDHHEDDSLSLYTGGNTEEDYNWDIWAQEIRYIEGQWLPYLDPFLIRSDAGRQTNPDIDGLDVVWQSQAPGVQDIYVWGPIPEPCTGLVLMLGMPVLLAGRRRLARRER